MQRDGGVGAVGGHGELAVSGALTIMRLAGLFICFRSDSKRFPQPEGALPCPTTPAIPANSRTARCCSAAEPPSPLPSVVRSPRDGRPVNPHAGGGRQVCHPRAQGPAAAGATQRPGRPSWSDSGDEGAGLRAWPLAGGHSDLSPCGHRPMGTARGIWPMIKWSCGQNGLSSV